MSYHGNVNISGADEMDSTDMHIYANDDPIDISDFSKKAENSDIEEHRSPQHSGRDYVKYKAAGVCLVQMCVLLLIVVISLSAHINTKSANGTRERKEQLANITNLNSEELLIEKYQLTEEKNKLRVYITDLTSERDRLRIEKNQLTKENEELSANITQLRDQLQFTKNRDKCFESTSPPALTNSTSGYGT